MQAFGYQRVRNRRVGASNREQDPLGAGLYVFSGVRWLDPDEPSEAQLIASGLTLLVRMFPELGCFAAGGQERMEAILRRNRGWWEQSAWKQSRRRRRRQTAALISGTIDDESQAPNDSTAICSHPGHMAQFGAIEPTEENRIALFLDFSLVNSCDSNTIANASFSAENPPQQLHSPPVQNTATWNSASPFPTGLPSIQDPFSLSEAPISYEAGEASAVQDAPQEAVRGGAPFPAWRWAWEEGELRPAESEPDPAGSPGPPRWPAPAPQWLTDPLPVPTSPGRRMSAPSAASSPRPRPGRGDAWRAVWHQGSLDPPPSGGAEGPLP